MATLQNIYSGYAFAGNPILLDIPTGRSGGVVDYDVSCGGGQIFKGRVLPPIQLNLADVARAAVDFIPDVPEGNIEPVVNLLDATGDFGSRYMEINVRQDDREENFALVVFPGGVSLQNFRRYAAGKTDVFQARLLNYTGNFFLTNYSDDRLIVMRETEISPLFFIAEGEMIIEFRELMTDRGLTLEYEIEPGVNAVDMAALRRKYYDLYRILPSQFDIRVNGHYSCRIVIRESQPRVADYRLIFRNSFGVKERMEISQDMETTAETGDKETSTRYDPATDTLTAVSLRTAVGIRLTGGTPVLDPGEISRLLDLLSSEDVWLEGFAPEPVKVIVSTDELTFPTRQNEPKTFTINIEIAEKTDFPTPTISTTEDSRGPRRFGDSFDIKFS